MDTYTNAFGVFSPPGSKTHPEMIRFIDSEYRELFQIPDGASIKVTYPPDDGREEAIRPCKYIDDYHFRVGSATYHICEFAERMERIGARYEPEAQLRGTVLTPFASGEEKFCTYNREEGNTCIGHIAGDFGQQGDRFHSSWYNHVTRSEKDWANNVTPEFRAELHSAVYMLRQGILKDHNTMLDYCQSQPMAKLPDSDGLALYGFKLETNTRQYFLLCRAEKTSIDSHFIIYAYADKPTHEKEHSENTKPSVIEQIKAAQKTPKPPHKAKPTLRGKAEVCL